MIFINIQYPTLFFVFFSFLRIYSRRMIYVVYFPVKNVHILCWNMFNDILILSSRYILVANAFYILWCFKSRKILVVNAFYILCFKSRKVLVANPFYILYVYMIEMKSLLLTNKFVFKALTNIKLVLYSLCFSSYWILYYSSISVLPYATYIVYVNVYERKIMYTL